MEEFLKEHRISKGALELLLKMGNGETFPFNSDITALTSEQRALVDGRYVEAKEVGMLFFKKSVYQLKPKGRGIVEEYRNLQEKGKV